jgi:putative hydrolase of the HAD superfamily
MTVRAILFDLDNTLTDRTGSIRVFAQRFLDDFRHALSPETTGEAVYQVILTGDGGGYRPKVELFEQVIRDLSWITPPQFTEISDYWYAVSPLCMQLRSGVLTTLSRLQTNGYRLGMITNGQTTVQNATIDAVGIRGYFQTILVSETVGLRKPDPRIFHLALSHLATTPAEAVYVGDHPVSDIQGAHDAGLHTIWLSDGQPWQLKHPQPDRQIHSFTEFLDIRNENLVFLA